MAEAGAGAAPRPGPARGIEAAFARAAARMADVPICNPALRVEAVGLRAWGGEWLGVVVSPWTLSLFIVPGGGGLFRPLGPDERQRWEFPSGAYDFVGGHDPVLGAFQTCSLLSPPAELGSQEDARAAALVALEALIAAPSPQPSPRAVNAEPPCPLAPPPPFDKLRVSGDGRGEEERGPLISTPSPQPSPPAHAGSEGVGGSLSRRGFLGGAWRRAR